MSYRQCLIIGFVGSKGGGKSLSMAAAITRKLLRGENVWSNMPVKTGPALMNRHSFEDGKTIEFSEVQPLDWNLLYMLDESMANGTIAIDEATYYADSRQTGSTRNRLINTAVRQVRHRDLDILYTALDFGMVDTRLRQETDVVIECEDIANKPWGKDNRVQRGTVILQRYFDITGAITGYRTNYFKDRVPYKSFLFHGMPYWDCYDTREITSLEEAFTSVKLDLQERKISNRTPGFDEGTRDIVFEVLANLKQQGKDRVTNEVLWEILAAEGVEGSPSQLGRYVPNELKRQGSNGKRFYDLTRFDPQAN